jgi:Glycosyl hydrolase family 47
MVGRPIVSHVAPRRVYLNYLSLLSQRSTPLGRLPIVLMNTCSSNGCLPGVQSPKHSICVRPDLWSKLLTYFAEWLLRLSDLASSKGIIDNLLHLTPDRKLLYVTDVSSGPTYYPSRTFEHLSCFLPGLFALGVHSLPESVLNGTDRELHAWAAEGLAETCWATYADTPTGLGPDEVSMKAWPTNQHTPTTTQEKEPALHLRQEPEEPGTHTGQPPDDPMAVGSRWMAHVDKWHKEGRAGGKPPGTKIVAPESNPEKRDWILMKDGYLLRPEVRLNSTPYSSVLMFYARQSKHFMFFGKQQGTQGGESEDGPSSNPSRSMPRRSMDTQASSRLTPIHLHGKMRCQGRFST